jgi:chorismate mutase/prephenate dehydratase
MNVTRFWVIGKCPMERTGKDKTSYLFFIENRKGSLAELLQVFAAKGSNLIVFQARPWKRTGQVWEYMFFMDFDFHKRDDIAKEAIDEIVKRELCIKHTLLGSYPQGGLGTAAIRLPGSNDTRSS